MELWNKNVEVLLRRNPALAPLVENGAHSENVSVEQAKNGEPICRSNGIYLHSSYDPSREAAGWLSSICCESSAPITVFGLGLGYHVKALAEAGFHGVFIEPDPAMFRLAMNHLDLTRVLEQFSPLIGIPPGKMRRTHRRLLSGATAAHPASLRINPAYFGELVNFSRSLALAKQGGLKILLVNPVSGGSLPIAGYCADAINMMGHVVEVFSAETFDAGVKFSNRFGLQQHRDSFRKELELLLSHGVELKAREFEPDLVLALAQAPLLPATLSRLAQSGIPTAFWFVEDYRVLPFWREVAAHYSHFFSIQQGDFSAELTKSGVQHHSYLPTAAAPGIHAPIEMTGPDLEEFGSPLSFVGAGYYNRQRFFRGLVDYPFKIWGSDWPPALPLSPFIQRGAARIDTETCIKIFNSSDINLNLHSSMHHEGVDPTGDFVNPRTFEIACCSAFQLVDCRSHMAELFDENEMETFDSMKELREKIDYFLAEPETRQAIAGRARIRVLAEHTYQARMEELLAVMIQEFPNIAERQQHRLDKRNAILSEMGKQEGLHEILSRMPKGRPVRLQDIYQTIKEDIFRPIGESHGEISRAEKIFLMLKNIDVAMEVKS